MIAATLFLCIFVIIGGVVMFLSKTIDHGEARFGPDGKVIREDAPKFDSEARPATRLDETTTPDAKTTKAKTDE